MSFKRRGNACADLRYFVAPTATLSLAMRWAMLVPINAWLPLTRAVDGES